jgi:RimJ/RimL family protein N-acetyltransferase
MKTPVLETARLILRPVTLEDAPAIQRHFARWEIIRNLAPPVPWPYPDDGADTFLKNIALPQMRCGGGHSWAITLKAAGNECIGIIGFRFNAEESHGNRGFWLAEEHQGQGLMTEAITATNDYIFLDLKIDRFQVVNAKGNAASRRVKEKTGAKFLRMGELLHHSGETEAEIWEVTRENWLSLSSSPRK